MTEQERKVMLNLADTLKGEINRMCVTKDISELDKMLLSAIVNLTELHNKMLLYAIVNLTELHKEKRGELIAERVAERVEHGETLHPGRMD